MKTFLSPHSPFRSVTSFRLSPIRTNPHEAVEVAHLSQALSKEGERKGLEVTGHARQVQDGHKFQPDKCQVLLCIKFQGDTFLAVVKERRLISSGLSPFETSPRGNGKLDP